jgi:CBS domain-containing protein
MQRTIIPGIIEIQDIVTLNKTASIHSAVQTMSTRSVAAVAVTDVDGQLLGIVSERDMTHRVLACGLNPQTTMLSDVMTENPVTLKPDDSALDAVELMLGRKFRHLPVVDDDGKILGIVSIRDLLRAALTDLNIELEFERAEAFAPESAPIQN